MAGGPTRLSISSNLVTQNQLESSQLLTAFVVSPVRGKS